MAGMSRLKGTSDQEPYLSNTESLSRLNWVSLSDQDLIFESRSVLRGSGDGAPISPS